MKSRIILVVCVLMSLGAMGQRKAQLRFNKTEHDFGRIKESDGSQMMEFKFMNIGKVPMHLTNVIAACGCTTPSWSKDTVYPGKMGSVFARFDPTGRSGEFNKVLTLVAANTDPEYFVLTIKGIVEPKDMTPAQKYPFAQGNLRIELDHIPFGIVKNNTYDTIVTRIYNEGFSTMKMSGFQGPTYIKWEAIPSELKPKTEGVVRGILSGPLVNDLGVLFTSTTMMTDDKDQPNKTFYTSVNVQEHFPPMSKKDSLSAPRASFDKTHYNWGSMTQGAVMQTDFILTNTGKSDLIIRKTKASCGCTASEPEKMVLKKGESTRIKVEFNSAGRQGHESKAIDVMTNDPFNPVINLTIAGEVVLPNQIKH